MKYNNKTYQSYVNNGFTTYVPNDVLSPERRAREFLSRVDESQGPIEREVTKIVRVKAIDYSSKKREKKEYVYYYEHWQGKNWLGQKINPYCDNVEGFWDEQFERAIKHNANFATNRCSNKGKNIQGVRSFERLARK